MRIKMLTTSADPHGVRLAGRIYDVPDAEADELIKRGYAVPADGKAPERAARPAPARNAARKNAPAKPPEPPEE